MSQAAKNMQRDEEKEVAPLPPHIDEFLRIMFKLGFITADDTTMLPREVIDDDSTRLSEILYLWSNEAGDTRPQATAVGQNIGYHLLSRCLENRSLTSSLRDTIDGIQDLYLQLARELSEYGDKPVEERGKEGMGPILRDIMGGCKFGREFPGLHKMEKVAHKLLAVLVGASEEIAGQMAKMERGDS